MSNKIISAGFYHSGLGSADGPEILFTDDHSTLAYSSQCHFSEGPFPTFSEAKKDLEEQIRNHLDGWRNAARNARALRQKGVIYG